ncbi:MAG: helicase SNF2, partial [Limisphaerales bacterium]
AKAIEARWQDAAERAKRNRTVFAQRRLKPEEVLPEWHKSLAALGGKEDVQRFTGRALARLGGALEPMKRGFKTPLTALPADVKDRLEAEGLQGAMLLDFDYPPAPRCRPVQRSHPLISVLAETLLERTLGAVADDSDLDPGVLGRVGCWVSSGIDSLTWVAVLRLRHQLTTQRGTQQTTALVEEATAIAWLGPGNPLEGADALKLLQPSPLSDPPPHVRERFVSQALEQLAAKARELDAFAERRAQALLADHRRVREAADARGSYSVKAMLPVDVIGLFVLLPQVT